MSIERCQICERLVDTEHEDMMYDKDLNATCMNHEPDPDEPELE